MQKSSSVWDKGQVCITDPTRDAELVVAFLRLDFREGLC